MSRPIPYPTDTRAKGWKFSLDHERVRQSDTWARAGASMRPWLLMLWMVAWEQTPCGSLPNDDELIAARLDMDPALFEGNRARLLRGWYEAEDGRLYHQVITEQVLEMIAAKSRERDRKAAYRLRQEALRHGDDADSEREEREGCDWSVPPESHGTRSDVPRDTTGTAPNVPWASTRIPPVGDDTGTGTSNRVPPSLRSGVTERRGAARPRPDEVPIAVLVAAGFDETSAQDFLDHKRRLKAPLTSRAWLGHKREAMSANLSPLDAANLVMERGWKGFVAAYIAGERRSMGLPLAGAAPQPVAQRTDLAAQLDADSARNTLATPEEVAARRQAAADIKARRAREALAAAAPTETTNG